MNALEAYEKFTALRLHFVSDFDYFKYKGKIKNVNPETFKARRDKYIFEKLAKKYTTQDLIMLFVSNLLDKKVGWIGSIITEECESVYLTFRKRLESLEYIFKEDLVEMSSVIVSKDVETQFKSLFIPKNHCLPFVVECYMNKNITLETLVILEQMFGWCKAANKRMDNNPVWDEIHRKIKKYSPFINIDQKSYENIFRRIFFNDN